MTHSLEELERAAYISGNVALADLYAQLDDNAQTIEAQDSDLENLRHQLNTLENME